MIVRAWVGDDSSSTQHDSSLMVPWWSFGKTVIAAAALALVRDRVLALDTCIGGQAFTLRQLLQHRSGLPDYGALPTYHEAVARSDKPWPVAELLARAQADQLLFAPGEGWSYSNIGYLYVRQLLEAVTAGSLGDALQQLVLGPLDVADVVVATSSTDMAGPGTGIPEGYDPGWVYHGLLLGRLRGAALLFHRLMTGNLLPPALLQDMLSPFVLDSPVAGRPWTSPGYGLGIMAGLCDGRPVAGHTGAGPGSVIAVYRGTGAAGSRTAAVFSTAEDPALVERAVLESLSHR